MDDQKLTELSREFQVCAEDARCTANYGQPWKENDRLATTLAYQQLKTHQTKPGR